MKYTGRKLKEVRFPLGGIGPVKRVLADGKTIVFTQEDDSLSFDCPSIKKKVRIEV